MALQAIKRKAVATDMKLIIECLERGPLKNRFNISQISFNNG